MMTILRLKTQETKKAREGQKERREKNHLLIVGNNIPCSCIAFSDEYTEKKREIQRRITGSNLDFFMQ